MERLTERDNGITFLVCREGCNGGPACIECEQKAIDRLAAYEDTMSIEQAQELAKTEKDGRLVVLPCKPGQTIWVESCIRGRVTNIEAPDITWVIENTERFSKEIFLTREEAEAALKKAEEADNEAD